MKNEKFLLDIQTKYGDIAYEIVNVAIDAEQTFKCRRPNLDSYVHIKKTYFVSRNTRIVSYYFIQDIYVFSCQVIARFSDMLVKGSYSHQLPKF